MHQHSEVTIKEIQANALSINCTGNWLALGGRRELLLLKLTEFVSERYKVPLATKWDTSLLQWHPNIPSYLAAVQNDRCQVFDWQGGTPTALLPSRTASTLTTASSSTTTGIERERSDSVYSMASASSTATAGAGASVSSPNNPLLQPVSQFKSQVRTITSLHWSYHDTQRLATTSVDSFNAVCVWDLREDCGERPTMRFESVSGASNFRWNRMSPHMFATSHDSDVRIWDLRRGTSPVHFISAHLSRVYDLDWNVNDENELITCGHDCRLKMWNINNPRACAFENNTTPLPCVRCRYTPFGSAVLTLPTPYRRNDGVVLLWHVDNHRFNLVTTFSGAEDTVVDFAWRRSPISLEYELFTWSRDHKLFCWRLSEDTLRQCGQSSSVPPLSTSSLLLCSNSGATGDTGEASEETSLVSQASQVRLQRSKSSVPSFEAFDPSITSMEEPSATTGVFLDDAEKGQDFLQQTFASIPSVALPTQHQLDGTNLHRKGSSEFPSSLNERQTHAHELHDKSATLLSTSLHDDRPNELAAVDASSTSRGFHSHLIGAHFLQAEFQSLAQHTQHQQHQVVNSGVFMVEWSDVETCRCCLRVISRLYISGYLGCQLVLVVLFQFSSRYPQHVPKFRLAGLELLIHVVGPGATAGAGAGMGGASPGNWTPGAGGTAETQMQHHIVPCSGPLALKVQEDCIMVIRESTAAAAERHEGCLERCGKALLGHLNSNTDQTSESLVHTSIATLKSMPRSLSYNAPLTPAAFHPYLSRLATSLTSRPGHFSSLPTPYHPHSLLPLLPERSYTTNKDMNVPYHRYTGAYFAPNGQLVCFKLAKAVYRTLEHEGRTPRAISGASSNARWYFHQRSLQSIQNASTTFTSTMQSSSSSSSTPGTVAAVSTATLSSSTNKISKRGSTPQRSNSSNPSSSAVSGTSGSSQSSSFVPHRYKNPSESMATTSSDMMTKFNESLLHAPFRKDGSDTGLLFMSRSGGHLSSGNSTTSNIASIETSVLPMSQHPHHPLSPPSVVIYACNFSLLLPVSQVLAKEYRFNFDKVSEMADYNATVVSNYAGANRDLLCFWRFVQEIALQRERILTEHANPKTQTNLRPTFCLETISKKLMLSWFVYFRDILDVQHLSFLSVLYCQVSQLFAPAADNTPSGMSSSGTRTYPSRSAPIINNEPQQLPGSKNVKPPSGGGAVAGGGGKRLSYSITGQKTGGKPPPPLGRTHNSSTSEASQRRDSTVISNSQSNPSGFSSTSTGNLETPMQRLMMKGLQESSSSDRRRSNSYTETLDDEDGDAASGHTADSSMEGDDMGNGMNSTCGAEPQLWWMGRAIRCYTQLLYMWGLLNQRAHLLNHWEEYCLQQTGGTMVLTEVPLGLTHGSTLWDGGSGITESIASTSSTIPTYQDGEHSSPIESGGSSLTMSNPGTPFMCKPRVDLRGNGSGAICARCKEPLHLRCSLCRGPVRGLSSMCNQCHHGGHLEHYLKWFNHQTQCPTGCGCRCEAMRFHLLGAQAVASTTSGPHSPNTQLHYHQQLGCTPQSEVAMSWMA